MGAEETCGRSGGRNSRACVDLIDVVVNGFAKVDPGEEATPCFEAGELRFHRIEIPVHRILIFVRDEALGQCVA
jgi:hypothetical protein